MIRTFETVGKRAADVALWTERVDGSVSTRGSATVVWSEQAESNSQRAVLGAETGANTSRRSGTGWLARHRGPPGVPTS